MNSKKKFIVLIPYREVSGGAGRYEGVKLNAHLDPLAAECCSLQLRAGCEDKETSALWESGNLVCLATNM